MTDLVLPVKGEFFYAIKYGTKLEEFRLRTPYWRKRLDGRIFFNVVVTLGYPERRDTARRLVLPWRGMREATIIHPFFGPYPVDVFAIRVSGHAFTTDQPHIGQT